MSEDTVDTRTGGDARLNDILAAGAVFASLHTAATPVSVEIVPDKHGQATNALWVRFHFLKSRYRVTVTMDPDPDGSSEDLPAWARARWLP